MKKISVILLTVLLLFVSTANIRTVAAEDEEDITVQEAQAQDETAEEDPAGDLQEDPAEELIEEEPLEETTVEETTDLSKEYDLLEEDK